MLYGIAELPSIKVGRSDPVAAKFTHYLTILMRLASWVVRNVKDLQCGRLAW